MEVSFASAKLQKVCNTQQNMVKAYGADCAKRLAERLQTMSRVETASELLEGLPGRWHPLRANLSGLLSADLKHPLRLIVRPLDGDENEGGIDWATVTKVEVVEITDTHEG